MIRNRFQHLKLRQMIFLLCLLIEIIVTCVILLSGHLIIRRYNDAVEQSMLGTLQVLSSNLNLAMEDVRNMTYKLLGDSQIQRHLTLVSEGTDDRSTLDSYQDLYNSLIRYQTEFRNLGVEDIELLTPAFDVSTRYMQRAAMDAEKRASMIALAANAGGRMVLVAGEQEGEILAIRSIRQVAPFNLKVTGTMLVHVSLDRLLSRVSGTVDHADSFMWLLDQDGRPFYRSPGLTEEMVPVILSAIDRAPGTVRFPEGHFYLIHGKLEQDPWYYSLLVPYEKQWQARIMAYLILALTFIGTILATSLLGNAFMSSISRQTEALLEKIERFKRKITESEPELPTDATESRNEFELLNEHFDSMAEMIDRLIREKYVNELLSKEAQIRALEAQMNPHFLYNVLQSINSRAQLAHHLEITRIVEALGRFLRISLDSKTKVLTLREELNLVHDYITIQKERFEDQLEYTENVPDELMEIRMPKMILQPLVENAVKYALENGFDDSCQIVLKAACQDGIIRIRIENSGSSFPEEMLGELDPTRLEPHGFGIGLRNIHSRLRLSFGDDYGIWLSNHGIWAVCEVRIPEKNGHMEDGYASNADCGR
ncbi:MAG: sensor histidine kinase [Clostridia bacterium]|nr:sensor histidine kinase [Clostridia bacterium]